MERSAVCVLMMLVLSCVLDRACLDDLPPVSEYDDGLSNQRSFTKSPPSVSMGVGTSRACCDQSSRHVKQTAEYGSFLNTSDHKAAATLYPTSSLDKKDEAEKELTRTEESRTSLSKEDSSTTPNTTVYSAKYQLGDVMDDGYTHVVVYPDNNVTTKETDGPLTDTGHHEDMAVDYVNGSVQETATPAITERGNTTASMKYQEEEENDWWVPLAIFCVTFVVVMMGVCVSFCSIEGHRRRSVDPIDANNIDIRETWV